MQLYRIVVADDHEIVVEGLRRVLDHANFQVVGTASDGRTLVQLVDELKPEMAILDVTMPLLNGIDAVRQIRKDNKSIKIIFLTMHFEVAYALEALQAGGNGYVLKTSAGEELVTAIETVRSGDVFITASIGDAVRQALAKRSRAGDRPGVLTARQREILQLLAEGRSIKEIAATLNISTRTVEFHKYGIMATLGARSIADLVLYAAKHRLVI